MANERGYAYAMPGGQVNRRYATSLQSRRAVQQPVNMRDFVTMSDAQDMVCTVKRNALFAIALILGGAWLYARGGKKSSGGSEMITDTATIREG